MTNRNTQSTESILDREGRGPSCSRRQLLIYATTLVSTTGTTVSGIVNAAETAEKHNSSDKNTGGNKSNIAEFDKVLRVKGTGSGANSYYIEASATIRQIGYAQQGQDDTAATGSVQKGESDLYGFNGWVRRISTRGSVKYHTYDQ